MTFGHFGDGNLHYNLSRAAPSARDDSRRRSRRAHGDANRIVHDLVAEYGGSISAEHGIGRLKRDEIKRYKSALELDLMRRIKQALDPQQIMNPGRSCERAGALQARPGAGRGSAVGKVIFWIVIIFAVLLVLRMYNMRQQQKKRRASRQGRTGRAGGDGPLRALRRLPAALRSTAGRRNAPLP